MRVLWITNTPFGYHNQLMKKETATIASGSWLYAAYDDIKKETNISLCIATVAEVNKVLSGSYNNDKFYILPGGNMAQYNSNSNENIGHWEKIKQEFKPQLVIIWGTESKFSLTASRIFRDIPIYVYIQGILKNIVHHYFDGIPFKYRLSTFRDIADLTLHRNPYYFYKNQIKLENEILKTAAGVIVENDWCAIQCKEINPDLKIIFSNLPIRKEFYEKKWNLETMNPLTIFTNAGGATIKGHHILFLALSIIKKQFNNVKLLIPGLNYLKELNNLKRRTGYLNYLKHIYEENKLERNIEFLGFLKPSEMADRIKECNVFAMPSLAENHSSSLIEALIVGAPCVSSLVGGTGSLITQGYNGFLYNSLEPTSLAGYISKIFIDNKLANDLSNNAFKIRETRVNKSNFIDEILKINQFENSK